MATTAAPRQGNEAAPVCSTLAARLQQTRAGGYGAGWDGGGRRGYGAPQGRGGAGRRGHASGCAGRRGAAGWEGTGGCASADEEGAAKYAREEALRTRNRATGVGAAQIQAGAEVNAREAGDAERPALAKDAKRRSSDTKLGYKRTSIQDLLDGGFWTSFCLFSYIT